MWPNKEIRVDQMCGIPTVALAGVGLSSWFGLASDLGSLRPLEMAEGSV